VAKLADDSAAMRGAGRKPKPAPPVDESRSEQILREAGLLFRTKGYENTTMRDIAEAAGLTPGALYWHFSSKEELLRQHLVSYEQPWLDAVRDVVERGTPQQQLRAFAQSYIQYQLDQPYLELGWGIFARTGQLMWRLPEEEQEQFWQIDRELLNVLEGILTRGIEAGVFRPLDVNLTANAIVNMCHIMGAWVVPNGDVDLAVVPRTYADLVEHMVIDGSAIPDTRKR